jgi:hypothetical protein
MRYTGSETEDRKRRRAQTCKNKNGDPDTGTAKERPGRQSWSPKEASRDGEKSMEARIRRGADGMGRPPRQNFSSHDVTSQGTETTARTAQEGRCCPPGAPDSKASVILAVGKDL